MNALVSGATATRERQIEDAKPTEGFGSPAASPLCLVHCTPTVSQRLSSVSAGEDIALLKSIKWTMSLQYVPLIMIKKLPSFHFVSCVFELILQKKKKT